MRAFFAFLFQAIVRLRIIQTGVTCKMFRSYSRRDSCSCFFHLWKNIVHVKLSSWFSSSSSFLLYIWQNIFSCLYCKINTWSHHINIVLWVRSCCWFHDLGDKNLNDMVLWCGIIGGARKDKCKNTIIYYK